MRAILLSLALLLATAARAEEPKLPEGSDTCMQCHSPGGDGPAVEAAPFAASVHAQNGVGCTDCHAGYTEEHAMGGTLPPLSDAEQKIVSRLEKGAWAMARRIAVTSPRAYLACKSCHSEQADAFADVHPREVAARGHEGVRRHLRLLPRLAARGEGARVLRAEGRARVSRCPRTAAR